MREGLLAILAGLAGCNQLLGIEDPPGDPCTGPCACRIDDDCGAHEYCNDQRKSRTCECVAGYARGETSCTWEGAVLDPGFADVAAWLTVKTASVDGTIATPDLKDPGVLRLPRGACGATALQRVVMPRLARAEPLAAVMTYRIPAPASATGAGPAFGIGRIWSEGRPAPKAQWFTERRCLGAGHYAAADSTGRGEEVQLSVGRTIDTACDGEAIEIDRFTIVRADPGECPPPGPVVNGLAEEPDGWMFTTAAGGLAGFVAGAGENASRGARLTLQQRCSTAAADVPLAPALADEAGGAMLSYYVSSIANTSIRGSLGPHTLPAIPALQPTIVRFCVPAHLRGGADRLRIAPSYDLTTPLCTDPVTASAVLDTVKLESAPACGADPAIADPGFESGTLAQTALSITGTPTAPSARALANDAAARTGTHALELRLGACPQSAAASVHVVTPPADSRGGPALEFWWKTDMMTTAPLEVLLDDATRGGLPPLASTQQWRRGVLCLDPKLVGRRRQVSFKLSATGACPGEQRALIDDLAATTDPACLAQ
jgi:hypothetical protein